MSSKLGNQEKSLHYIYNEHAGDNDYLEFEKREWKSTNDLRIRSMIPTELPLPKGLNVAEAKTQSFRHGESNWSAGHRINPNTTVLEIASLKLYKWKVRCLQRKVLGRTFSTSQRITYTHTCIYMTLFYLEFIEKLRISSRKFVNIKTARTTTNCTISIKELRPRFEKNIILCWTFVHTTWYNYMFWILTEPYSIKLCLLLNTAKLVKKQEKPSTNRMSRFDVNNIFSEKLSGGRHVSRGWLRNYFITTRTPTTVRKQKFHTLLSKTIFIRIFSA